MADHGSMQCVWSAESIVAEQEAYYAMHYHVADLSHLDGMWRLSRATNDAMTEFLFFCDAPVKIALTVM